MDDNGIDPNRLFLLAAVYQSSSPEIRQWRSGQICVSVTVSAHEYDFYLSSLCVLVDVSEAQVCGEKVPLPSLNWPVVKKQNKTEHDKNSAAFRRPAVFRKFTGELR